MDGEDVKRAREGKADGCAEAADHMYPDRHRSQWIFKGKADFGTYVDKAVQKILTDPSADPEKEFSEAQSLCEKEALEKFNEANRK